MARKVKDYDQALQGLEDIVVVIKGERYTFPGDPAASMVIEWYVYNTTFDPMLNQGEKLETNWRLLFGDSTYEAMVGAGVGGRTLDALYTDLLDWWHIVRTPKAEDDGGLPDEVWESVPPSVQPLLRQYVLELEDRIDELEDDLGITDDREEEPVGEPTG